MGEMSCAVVPGKQRWWWQDDDVGNVGNEIKCTETVGRLSWVRGVKGSTEYLK